MKETILLIFCVLALSLSGQALMKKGITQIGMITLEALMQNPLGRACAMLTNPLIIMGLFLAAIGAFLWLIVLSRADLGYALPLLGGLAYLLIPFISWLFLGEQLTVYRVLGILFIGGGVLLLTVKSPWTR